MSRPSFQFPTPPSHGHESWDAEAQHSFERVLAVLRDSPWIVGSYAGESELPAPSSYRNCIAVAGPTGTRWLYLSDGVRWHRLGRQAAAQADSIATTLVDLRGDYNALLARLRDAGWIAGAAPPDPNSRRLSRFAAEAFAKLASGPAIPRATRMGAEVFSFIAPDLIPLAATREAIEVFGRYSEQAPNTYGFPRTFSGFLQPHGGSIAHSQGARWETNGRIARVVFWRGDIGGPWIAKLKSAYPDRIAIGSFDDFMPSDGTLSATYADWYLRTPSGTAKQIGGNGNTPQFHAWSGDRRLHPDPAGRLPAINISAAQYLAREACDDAMQLAAYDWDGIEHDFFWDAPTWALGDADYDRNGASDAPADALARFQEDRQNYWQAMRERFLEVSGREPFLCYQPGGVSQTYLHPYVSMMIAEGWYWNAVWWALFSTMQASRTADFGLERKLGFGMNVRLNGFNATENNYIPVDDACTYRTNEPPGAGHTDSQRKLNLRNKYQAFGFARFNTTFTCLADGWIQHDSNEHSYQLSYDEYVTDLGQPLAEAWRVAKGPVGPNRNPNSEPTWPYNGSGESNLYAAVFIRFFERGAVIHYAPRNYLMTTIEVTAADLDTAWAALGLPGSRPTHYRFLGTQAPIQIYVGACQDLADNLGLFGRETTGTWNQTIKSDWATADDSLGVFGQQARYKAGGTGTAKLKWRFRCDRTDDYDVFVKHPYSGHSDQPAYCVDIWQGGALATNAQYTVEHDDGAGSKTTTLVTGINLQEKVRGHKLGRFRFVAGQSYYVELSDQANGVVLADGIYLQSVLERHNDGSEFSSQVMFGGVASMRDYNPDGSGGGNWTKAINGDGLILKTEANFLAQAGGIVGCYPCHDTTPGTNHKECEYSGSWANSADATHWPDSSAHPVDLDNPYFSQLIYGVEQGSVHGYGYRSIAAGTAGAKATYRYTVVFAGHYVVQEWHGWVGKDRSGAECTSVPYDLRVNSLSQFTGAIDQSTGEGRWNNVRTVLNLAAGDVIELELNAQTATGGTTVISDAVRFLKL